MKELTMTSAQQRMVRGETQYNRVSRFVREIPRELVDLGHTVMEHKAKAPGDKISAQQLSADEEKLPYEGISAAEF